MAEGSNKGLLTLNIIQFIIIGVLAYLLFDSNEQIESLNQNLTSTTEEVTDLKADLLDTRDNLEKVRAEREALGLSVDSLDAQIAELDKFVVQLKNQNNLSKAQIRKLNARVSTLNKEIETQQAEIDSLNEQNKKLTQNVDSLSKENSNLNQNVEQLAIEKENLQKDLKIASILNAEEIEVIGLKDNNKELTKQPFSKSKLARFKVTFSIGENKAADHNKKTFYMRMITPSGECFSDKINGGGSFKDHDGNVTKYTMKKTLLFENTNQWLSFVMPKGFNYQPGNYIIQIYCEGYDIGQKSFIVK